MTSITTKDGTKIAYKDWGKGQPILFSHGWQLAGDAWDASEGSFDIVIVGIESK
jgi:non-heme chloroperoxidase